MKSLAERIAFNLIVATVATLTVFSFYLIRPYVTTYGGLQPGVRIDSPVGNSCAGIERSKGIHFYAYRDCRSL